MMVMEPETAWQRLTQDKPRPRLRRFIVGALLVVTGFGVATVLAPQEVEPWTIEPDGPASIDMGGVAVKTSCGAKGQRVYLATPQGSSSGIGLHLTVPGALAVVEDKGCP